MNSLCNSNCHTFNLNATIKTFGDFMYKHFDNITLTGFKLLMNCTLCKCSYILNNINKLVCGEPGSKLFIQLLHVVFGTLSSNTMLDHYSKVFYFIFVGVMVMLGLHTYKYSPLCYAEERQTVLDSRGCKYVNNSTCTCTNEIPDEILDGTTTVVLHFSHLTQDLLITADDFKSSNYKRIKRLEIHCPDRYNFSVIMTSGCLTGLVDSEELHIDVIRLVLADGAFRGLEKTRMLSLLNCKVLDCTQFHQSFSAKNSLLGLKELKINDGFLYKNYGLDLNGDFWRAISARSVSHIDLSGTKISHIDASEFIANCESVESLKLSDTYIDVLEGGKGHLTVCKKLKVLDVSRSRWPSKISNMLCKSRSNMNVLLPVDFLHPLSAVENVIFDGLCLSESTVDFHDITSVVFLTFLQWRLKTLSLRNLRLHVLDIQLICTHPTVNKILLSDNLIKYINPDLLGCIRSLQYLDLSNNNLHLMSSSNTSLFEKLLQTFADLQYVSFSGNKLDIIPKRMFYENRKLEEIDLSSMILRL